MSELVDHRLLAEGREAEIYEWGPGRVLRLMRSADQQPEMDGATAAIAAAIEHGVPTPAVVDVVEVDGRPGQVMERVDGPDQLTLMGARPWMLFGLARSLGRVQAGLHAISLSEDYPTVHERVRDRLAHTDLVPGDIIEAASAVLDELPDGRVVCHGDFHPGNVLETADGPVVIDWTGATRGPAMADVARTRMMLRLGELPPGTPALTRLLTHVGRGLFHRRYVQAYRRAGDLDDDLVGRWAPVRAAERLAEGIEEEREALLVSCRKGLGIDGGP